MTTIEIIGLLGSSASISQILSKFFVPSEAVDLNVTMQYDAEKACLAYDAKFVIPRSRRFLFKKKIPKIQLDCAEGFLSINARLQTETELRELILPTLNCSLPPLVGREEVKSLAGKRLHLTIQISINLSHRIACRWAQLESNHLKATVTNTMGIPVTDFRTQIKMPPERKLKKASLIRNRTPEPVPVILYHDVKLYSNSGNLESELPNADTSNSSWLNLPDAEKSSEIIVPIDHLEPTKGLIIDLLFE